MAITIGEFVFITLNGLVLLWCVFSNSCIIGLVLKNKRMRNPTNMLICNLAFSDILLGGIVLPQNLHDISHTDDFHEGELACRIVNFLPVLLIIASIYTLVAMSYERHRAIVISSTSAILTKSQMAKIIATIWCGSALCTIPSLIEYSVYTIPITARHTVIDRPEEENDDIVVDSQTTTMSTYSTSEGSILDLNTTTYDNATSTIGVPELQYSIRCGSNGMPWAFSVFNGIFLLLIAYLIPTVLIWSQYGKLINYIISFNKRQPQTGAGSTSFIIFKNKVQIVKMLVIVAALFELCWLPYFSLLIYAKITGLDDSAMLDGWLNMMRITLSSFSVSYNAILYIIYNRHFKRGFQKIFCPCYAQAQGTNQIMPSTFQTLAVAPSGVSKMH